MASLFELNTLGRRLRRLVQESETVKPEPKFGHAIGGGVVRACLVETLTREDVESLALGIVDWHKTLAPAGNATCVFRDCAFEDDVAKTNLAAILEQHGLVNVRNL